MALAMAAGALETTLTAYEAFCGCGDGGDNFVYNSDKKKIKWIFIVDICYSDTTC
jgi:hypothetical protein